MESNEKIAGLTGDNEAKQHFINEEKFQLLRRYQQAIYDATEVSPSIRKLVNELINDENMQKVKTKIVAVWSN